jgi:hypothetical protein
LHELGKASITVSRRISMLITAVAH